MKAFSAIEIIIVLAIAFILLLIVTTAFSGFRDAQVLNSSSDEIAALINEARSKTLASAESSEYGIHFSATTTVFFKGEVFNPSDPENKKLQIPALIETFSINLNGGGSDLIFQKLTGKTDQYGTVAVRIRKDPAKIRKIIIGPAGIITIQQ